MPLPIQAPSIDRGFARGASNDEINPSGCCNYSCGGNTYSVNAANCNDCSADANRVCGAGTMTACLCGGVGGKM